jgi:hypothetical protein
MALEDEVSGAVLEPDHGVGTGRDADQGVDVHELQIAAVARPHEPAALFEPPQDLTCRWACLPVTSVARRDRGVDRQGEVVRDAGDHPRKLDRLAM